jgi:hypothetical protein
MQRACKKGCLKDCLPLFCGTTKRQNSSKHKQTSRAEKRKSKQKATSDPKGKKVKVSLTV